MRKRLDRLDEGLRRALLLPAGAAALAALGALTLLACAALLATDVLPMPGVTQWGVRVQTLLCLIAPLALMLCFAQRAARDNEMGLLSAAAVCAACAAAWLMRLCFLSHVSGDYEIYFSDWIARFAGMSFQEGMRAGIGEYNALYRYILFVISRLGVPPLYALKAVSFLGDALLAGALARLGAAEGRASVMALLGALLLPAVAVNSALFAQCDSLYTAFALWGLAWALGGRHGRSAVCFALSLAFKLQAVFLLPIVAVLWAGRRLRLADALVFLGTLLLTALPALLGGMPFSSLIGIYASQVGLYTDLTYGAPNLFGLMNTTGLNVYAYGYFGIALALGVCALALAQGVAKAQSLRDTDYVALSLLISLGIFFFLPRMHERYIYLPCVLSWAAACKDGRYIPCAALLGLAAFGALIDTGLTLCALSLAVFAALCLVIWAICCTKKG